ncbi:MAG: right-handed parallel beta-helix repeat-containing protein [Candidatus Heimdallarchaeota archaeon]|nr:right-handed parallel beta-helix repeat-containing protein [Candidatus Heimdallarchaeota archaeon]MCK4610479.1 right-handed parallel beta-helix repeat-containing protein [Candidatus Heimdallarchaeota archaeon]
MKKNNIKFVYIFLLFFLGVLFSSINSLTPTAKADLSTVIPYENPTLQALVDRGPIVIEYDANFTDLGSPGTGDPGDPFRIENYNITVTSDYPILFSGNNSKHFVIQNCFLKTDTNYGIYLGKYYLMGNGTVNILNNVIISETNNGIALAGGSSAIITGNTIETGMNGIKITDSEFCVVSYNTISGGYVGIYTDRAPKSTITKNICTNNDYGIAVIESSETSVTHNNCSNSAYVGIETQDSIDLTITNNRCINSGFFGMRFYDTVNCIITNNLLKENDQYGITMLSSVGVSKIYHNVFLDNNLLGTSQAEDDTGNQWYDEISLSGNWWSTWVSGSYAIDGSAGSVDLYPLNYIPEISEFSNMSLVILLIASILAAPVVDLARKKK